MPAKNPEPHRYSFLVQIIAFSLFWLIPSIWISHLFKKFTGIQPNDILLWMGFVTLNLGTYSIGREASATVNAYALWILIVLQIISWIWL